MFEEIEVKPVSKRTFRAKMKDLEPELYNEIEDALRWEESEVEAYFYGRIPGRRIYRVLFGNGTVFEWKAFKRKRDY